MLHTPKKSKINCCDAFKSKLKSFYGAFISFPPLKTPLELVVRHLCRAVPPAVVPSFCQPCCNRRCIFHVFQEQGLKQGIGSGFHRDCVVAVSPVALLLCCKNNSVLNALGRDIWQKSLLFYTADISCHGTMEPRDTGAVVRAKNHLASRENGKGNPQFLILTSPTITV